MPKKESTIVNAVLFSLYAAGAVAEELLRLGMRSPYEWRRIALYGTDYKGYRQAVRNSQNRGLVEVISQNGKKFLKLTKKGELEVLLAKAKLSKPKKWDGKWRLIIFDIPEDAKPLRNQFRSLLKRNDFHKLQASVYTSPYPLNREAVIYLEKTGLMKFIRILKVEEMDNDKDLKKHFGLH